MPHVMCILGTRPEIIKMAPVLHALSKKRNVKITLVHSGQHYDRDMSESFFETLDLPEPDIDLKVGSGTYSQQTASMLTGYKRVISGLKPDTILAEGDTNTVAAAGLASMKLHASFGHVEAGLRSFDLAMPEEVNRMIADDCAKMCFAPTRISAANLTRETIMRYRIFITGNTIVEACRKNVTIARRRSKILTEIMKDEEHPLVLTTVHRQENADDPRRLRRILRALATLAEFRIVYPIHPRTRMRLRESGLHRTLDKSSHVIQTDPLGYWDFLRLLDASSMVLTDSGGVQEEALTLGVPCLTLRYNTERPETVKAGSNVLVGTEVQMIVRQARRLAESRPHFRKKRNPLGDGKAGQRIADICSKRKTSPFRCPAYLKDASAGCHLLVVKRDRDVGWLRTRCPSIVIEAVYDSEGALIHPHATLTLRNGWHIQIFGPPADLVTYPAYLAG